MGGMFGGGGGGGGGSSHTVVQRHYIQDPAILKQVQEQSGQIRELTALVAKLENQLQQALLEAKAKKDPKLYKKLKTEAFQIFLENIQTLKFEEKIPKKNGELHHVLIGNISAGKTSLINYTCNTQLPVGVGETTQQIRKVAGSLDGRVHIWDSPGVNEDFAFYDPDVLAYFHSADRIFIIFPDSLKSCNQMIQVLYKIKPSNTYLVRTQCDRCDSTHAKTIQQEIETDKKLLYGWGIKLPVLATSSKRPESFLDNAEFMRLLAGKQ